MKALRRLIANWFPILKTNAHAPRLGKIEKITDAPTTGGKNSYSRPRFAVDIQPLDSHFKPDGPLLKDVICLVPYAGQQRGFFALPDPGCIVEYTHSYFLPHLIHVRGVIPWGLDLPPLNINEARWQQSNRVYQGYDQAGSWRRVTDQHIKERAEKIINQSAKLKHLLRVDNGGKIWLGNDTDNVLQILSDFMSDTAAALNTLAAHTHSGSPPPDQGGAVSSKAGKINGDKSGRLDVMKE